MLAELKVSNLALIRNLTLSFGPGANILTGETGAGKSILAGALGLVRGAKASADLVRAGAEEARVQALFQLERPEDFAPILTEMGLEPTDEIIVQRVIGANGRSKIYLNGSFVPLNKLAALGEELLAVSGQHDQQSLVREARQLDFLDAFGDHRELLARMGQAHREREALGSKIAALEDELRMGDERRELLEYQLKEIEKVAPKVGEDQELIDIKSTAKSAGKLTKILAEAMELFSGPRGGGLSAQLDRLEAITGRAAGLDERVTPLAEAVSEASSLLADVSDGIYKLGKDLGPGPEELGEVEERLSLLAKLKRKYGPSLEEVIEKGQANKNLLARLDSAAFELNKLSKEMALSVEKARQAALALRAAREKAATALAKNLTATLKVLGFPKLTMKIQLSPLEGEKAPDGSQNGAPGKAKGHKPGQNAGRDPEFDPERDPGLAAGAKGADAVSFLFCPNPGEGLKPLSRIASGGELSRMMMALKIAQEPRSDQSLVFDEIDSGLSGQTAEAVALKMSELATRQQVLVITHLPQMASLPGRHFLVAKSPDQSGDRTETSITELDRDLRELELARMLDGARPSPEAMALSRRLLDHGAK
ncbi:MAG: DNA repair protein RecN [Deltaproteobacteria bacterium]|jgi:DNA repair protein RecN (Recombination protein N)|nr:DNA repair protein RecN [Deltaproteobacteria bacterium]